MFELYKSFVTKKPLVAILLVLSLIVGIGVYVPEFKLDASADSLVLENDQDLKYFRTISARYGSEDFLFVTYTPKNADLFADEVLQDIDALSNELVALERIVSVTNILNVPLINSPKVTLSEIENGIRTLRSAETDRQLAREEFLASPLYKDMLLSRDANTTALQVNFHRDENYYELLNTRNTLREKQLAGKLTAEEQENLNGITQAFNAYSAKVVENQRADIDSVRAVLDRYRDNADIFLGGIPMITSDMIAFIEDDIAVFGIGILVFLIVMLGTIFQRIRWVVTPMLCCFTVAWVMVGFLGWVDWRVTVISSNFISLLLIITMSITVHLIVRYRELHIANPGYGQKELVTETIRLMIKPCFYTALTTMVAFMSLVVSGIRPVIDFGWMMTVGIALAFVICFLIFPALLVFIKPGKPAKTSNITTIVTVGIANFIHRYHRGVLIGFVAITVLSVIGIMRLTVENRFIDYFKETTEIYQGMTLIDKKLGGTVPLDIILDADADFLNDINDQSTDEGLDELFGDDFEFEEDESEAQQANYWFNNFMLGKVGQVHDYLEGLTETGKVLSIATSMKMVEQLNGGPIEDFELAVVRQRLPDDIKVSLINPYIAEDSNQVRLTARIIESDPTLKRQALIEKVKADIVEKFELKEDQVHLTGMLVLYNNMLQSLFDSQIKTLGTVMLCIMLMFVVAFRSVFLAIITIIPNAIAAIIILGLMGWLGIPLDLMTITIAAITVGIAVDDAIHYIHRFKAEFVKDRDYEAAIKRCHGSIGQAMYYTSLIIITGFSILVLSRFIPTIYFGVLTGLAMLIALLANLALLPRLLVLFKPLGTR